MPKTATNTKPKSAAQAKPPAQKSPVRPSKPARPRAASTRSNTTEALGPRRLTLPKRIWYKPLTWRNRPPVPAYVPLPKARVLLWRTLKQLWDNKKLFGGICAVYALLNILLVRGLASSGSLTSVKATVDTVAHGFSGKLATSLTGFVTLPSGSGTGATATSGVYQYVLLTICGLAVIWSYRQLTARQPAGVRDSFYQGMYPLVPFVLVQLIIGVQLTPLMIGGGIYNLLVPGGIVLHAGEKAVVITVSILLALWSLRMLGSSIFGVFIATLPNMTPLHALRSARQLVYGRRLKVWRKLVYLPVMLLVIAAVIELPLILFWTAAAPWVFFGLSMLALPVAYGYLYNLYREML
jgi:hypothetical protein